jgi:hypothetical protein
MPSRRALPATAYQIAAIPKRHFGARVGRKKVSLSCPDFRGNGRVVRQILGPKSTVLRRQLLACFRVQHHLDHTGTAPYALRIHAVAPPNTRRSTSNPGLEVLRRVFGGHTKEIRRGEGERRAGFIVSACALEGWSRFAQPMAARVHNTAEILGTTPPKKVGRKGWRFGAFIREA